MNHRLVKLITLLSPLLLFSCKHKPALVTENDLTYPVVAVESDHYIQGHLDATQLTTTNMRGIDRYPGMSVLGADGSLYTVKKADVVGKKPFWLTDIAGNEPVRVTLTLERSRQLNVEQARQFIVELIQNKGDYLDHVDGGRAHVISDIQNKSSLADIARAFQQEYDPQRVMHEAIKKYNKEVEQKAREGR